MDKKQILAKAKGILHARQTNFPEAGDDKKISLRNSKYQLFPVEEAQALKDDYLSIWREGGKIRGNAQFILLAPIARRGGNTETVAEENAVKRREAWASRHYENHSLAGVVAQIKWLVVGSRGLDHMRAVIREAKDKLEEKKVEQERVEPLAGQSKDEYLAYCMASSTMMGEFPQDDQRYAVCLSKWEGKGVKEGLEDACWDGFEAIGLKPNGDPNCVPIQ